MVVHDCNLSYSESIDKRIMVLSQCGQKDKTLSEKQTKSKMIGGVVQVVEHLPCKCEALNSIPSIV
jgi:hypothetical protein